MEWISANQYWPTFSGKYLTWVVDLHTGDNGRYWISDYDMVWGFHLSNHKATHWMPLPQPPEEAE